MQKLSGRWVLGSIPPIPTVRRHQGRGGRKNVRATGVLQKHNNWTLHGCWESVPVEAPILNNFLVCGCTHMMHMFYDKDIWWEVNALVTFHCVTIIKCVCTDPDFMVVGTSQTVLKKLRCNSSAMCWDLDRLKRWDKREIGEAAAQATSISIFMLNTIHYFSAF